MTQTTNKTKPGSKMTRTLIGRLINLCLHNKLIKNNVCFFFNLN